MTSSGDGGGNGDDVDVESSWVVVTENLGCGFGLLLFFVWLIGTMITHNPLWFTGGVAK